MIKDPEWALAHLRKWIMLHERVAVAHGTNKTSTAFRGSREERASESHVLQQIALSLFGGEQRWYRQPSESLARRCIAEIQHGEEIRQMLDPDDQPTLAAQNFHPWVWDAARALWLSGNHGAAIWAAAINVNTRLKHKVGRDDLGEAKLIQECFSIQDPQPGRPRLRLCAPDNPDLFKSRHMGAMHLGEGLYAAVRNPLNHVGPEDMTEQEALESLAGFSLLARWIAAASVATVGFAFTETDADPGSDGDDS